MKQPAINKTDHCQFPPAAQLPRGAWGAVNLSWAMVAIVVLTLMIQPARAQTVVITPQTPNYWVGANTTNGLGAGSNAVVVTSGNGSPIVLAVTGQPAGLATVLSTNNFTNSVSLGLVFSATNVAAGTYPLTISASGAASYSTNATLFVVPQWAFTNGTANWSSSSSWSSGVAPGVNDSVYIENLTGSTARPGFTNIVDVSTSIQALILLGDNDANLALASACAMQIPANVTLSVLGTNGFAIGNKTSNSTRPLYTFSGAGSLVVSNPAANFVVNNAGNARATTVLMTNLNNFSATVSRFSVGDVSLLNQGLYGPVADSLALARTNQITALFADNYLAPSFNTSIQFANLADLTGGSLVNTAFQFALGTSNQIFADSIGVGRGKSAGSGSSPFSIFGPTLRFWPALSNSVAPTASAYIRGTNGGRMSLLAVGVDSGTLATGNNCQGNIDLRGGTVNLQVDQIWLGRNRTNSVTARVVGGLYFDWGTINANTVIVGNMQYTNATAQIAGYLLVGTNGTLTVNSNLVLGLTPTNVTGFSTQAGAASGQIQINRGGLLQANQITVGLYSTNAITIAAGGTLAVSNTIASPAAALSTLTINGGGLTLNMNGANTLVYVTNLVASGGIINIGSITGSSTFTHLISYAPGGGEAASFIAGSVPAGYNATLFNNNTTHTIDLTLTAGTPKALLWQGYVNNTWDNSTKNWLDTATLLATNFTTGDSVAFDDTGAFSAINVAEDVVPRQAAGFNGIAMTNNSLSYIFTGSGGIRGAASFVKYGTGSVEVDNYSEVALTVNQGSLTGSGTIGSAAIATGATGLWLGSGTVLGNVVNSGSLTNVGTIKGALTTQTGSSLTYNLGTVNGALTMQAGTYLYNSGTLNAVGAATVTTNSMLVNGGTINGTSLTVAIGGNLTDLVLNSAGVSPGSINVGTLIINGTFNPGGSAIGTTKVTDYDNNGNQQGAPNGRIQLSAGSVTTLQFNSTNVQPYTKLLSQSQVYGPSVTSKSINGCTLLITNVGPTSFAAGQTFKFFGQYYTDGNPGNAGLNTTNTYPIVKPNVPGPGLLWDLSQLYASGTIGVISASSVQINLTNSFAVFGGTNIVASLTWPPSFVGNGWLQQQISTLTNGLSTNWTDVGQSDYVNTISLTNTVTGGSAIFYRFVRP